MMDIDAADMKSTNESELSVSESPEWSRNSLLSSNSGQSDVLDHTDGDSAVYDSADDIKIVKKIRLFTAAQTSVLKEYYKTGMKGTREACLPMIEKAERETGLSVSQVKVCIYCTMSCMYSYEKK